MALWCRPLFQSQDKSSNSNMVQSFPCPNQPQFRVWDFVNQSFSHIWDSAFKIVESELVTILSSKLRISVFWVWVSLSPYEMLWTLAQNFLCPLCLGYLWLLNLSILNPRIETQGNSNMVVRVDSLDQILTKFWPFCVLV